MNRRPPLISCGRCGKRFASWDATRLCGTCTLPDAPALSLQPRLGSREARGQLSLLDAAPTLPLRDGAQWLELPGETWEDIFYPPGEVVT